MVAVTAHFVSVKVLDNPIKKSIFFEWDMNKKNSNKDHSKQSVMLQSSQKPRVFRDSI